MLASSLQRYCPGKSVSQSTTALTSATRGLLEGTTGLSVVDSLVSFGSSSKPDVGSPPTLGSTEHSDKYMRKELVRNRKRKPKVLLRDGCILSEVTSTVLRLAHFGFWLRF